MPPQIVFVLRHLHTGPRKTLIDSGAGNGDGEHDPITTSTIIRMVVALGV